MMIGIALSDIDLGQRSHVSDMRKAQTYVKNGCLAFASRFHFHKDLHVACLKFDLVCPVTTPTSLQAPKYVPSIILFISPCSSFTREHQRNSYNFRLAYGYSILRYTHYPPISILA